MMFELPHFALELLVVLPCVQVPCTHMTAETCQKHPAEQVLFSAPTLTCFCIYLTGILCLAQAMRRERGVALYVAAGFSEGLQ